MWNILNPICHLLTPPSKLKYEDERPKFASTQISHQVLSLADLEIECES